MFDADGKFLTQWQGVGHPYTIFVSPDPHVWMADAEALWSRSSISDPFLVDLHDKAA